MRWIPWLLGRALRCALRVYASEGAFVWAANVALVLWVSLIIVLFSYQCLPRRAYEVPGTAVPCWEIDPRCSDTPPAELH